MFPSAARIDPPAPLLVRLAGNVVGTPQCDGARAAEGFAVLHPAIGLDRNLDIERACRPFDVRGSADLRMIFGIFIEARRELLLGGALGTGRAQRPGLSIVALPDPTTIVLAAIRPALGP